MSIEIRIGGIYRRIVGLDVDVNVDSIGGYLCIFIAPAWNPCHVSSQDKLQALCFDS